MNYYGQENDNGLWPTFKIRRERKGDKPSYRGQVMSTQPDPHLMQVSRTRDINLQPILKTVRLWVEIQKSGAHL